MASASEQSFQEEREAALCDPVTRFGGTRSIPAEETRKTTSGNVMYVHPPAHVRTVNVLNVYAASLSEGCAES
eukprot:scaffold28_cov312-Pinguiococcus_pyrenoidosus.AAC.14